MIPLNALFYLVENIFLFIVKEVLTVLSVGNQCPQWLILYSK